MYKLWSALTKNIRYIIEQKGKSVTLSRFGTLTKSAVDPQRVNFIQSSELANSLGAEMSIEQS